MRRWTFLLFAGLALVMLSGLAAASAWAQGAPPGKAAAPQAGVPSAMDEEAPTSGSKVYVLVISALLMAITAYLLIHFWRKDRERRLRRAKIKLPDPNEYIKKQQDIFATYAPGLHVGETREEPEPPPAAPVPTSITGRMTEAIFLDEELDMAEKIAIQKLVEEFELLETKLSQTAEAVAKLNQRLDQWPKQPTLPPGLLKAEERFAALEQSLAQQKAVEPKPAGMDQATLKKFNALELLINQSLSEMGRLLGDYEQRLQRIEMKVIND